ncbi:MAG: hypothetical protein IPP19_00425 [Verrucomicrobia bacterium]|nr:hypothetical protein [Verrucomicrobiota bacterium]
MNTNGKHPAPLALRRRRFIIRFGVIGWGLTTAVLFTAWTAYSKENVRTLDLVLPFILFPIGGIAWGYFMWAFLMWRHNRN